ncbi:MAG: hypothetical protein U0232_08535 [Thermomicrobiales bacterium]
MGPTVMRASGGIVGGKVGGAAVDVASAMRGGVTVAVAAGGVADGESV